MNYSYILLLLFNIVLFFVKEWPRTVGHVHVLTNRRFGVFLDPMVTAGWLTILVKILIFYKGICTK